MKTHRILAALVVALITLPMNAQNTDKQATYGSDLAFLKQHLPDLIELRDESGNAALAISPALQGRIMTSTADGSQGFSFGWINRSLIESKRIQPHINAYGGEERLWLGPEGGQYSFYFSQGKEFSFDNWQVPAVIDTEPFEVVDADTRKATFRRNFRLTNYAGQLFDIQIVREVELLGPATVSQWLGLDLPDSVRMVAWQSVNTIENNGNAAWTQQTGLPSIWMLCMFTPTPDMVVLVPYNNHDSIQTQVVNDSYFGKVPGDRLKDDGKCLYFKADGKYRSKIGLDYFRATDRLGAWDRKNNTLTILQYNKPHDYQPYVNSMWEIQEKPFQGDVINSYNDGPVADGSQMGPFFELESSSPGAQLAPGTQLSHTQRVYHFQGSDQALARIASALLNVTSDDLHAAFFSE